MRPLAYKNMRIIAFSVMHEKEIELRNIEKEKEIRTCIMKTGQLFLIP